MKRLASVAVSAITFAFLLTGCAGIATSSSSIGGASAPFVTHSELQPKTHGDTSSVRIWTTLSASNYLIGTTGGGTPISAINVGAEGCYSPVTVKVDHTRNIWLACQSAPGPGTSLLQEYSSGGALEHSDPVVCPAYAPAYCTSLSSVSYDGVAAGTNGPNSLVVLGLTSISATVCDPSCQPFSSTGIEFWYGCPSYCSAPYFVFADSPGGAGIQNFYYMDLAGISLYFDFYGCTPSGVHCGIGLGCINLDRNSLITIRTVEPPGTYGQPGGVIVSSSGSVLSVIDSSIPGVDQYTLPNRGACDLPYGQRPFKVLGPIARGAGVPVSGGFNKYETKIAIGDANDWLDIGTIATNRWKVAKSPLFTTNLYGAAYTPSDK